MRTRFLLEEIPSGGVELIGPLERQWFGPLLFDQYHVESSELFIKARLYKTGKNVVLEGELKASLSFDCSRCAEEAKAEVSHRFARVFWGPGAAHVALDLEVEEDEDIEEDHIDGNLVDIEPALAEEFVMMIPPYPLCKPDCKGLCPICGHNLNEGDCGCDRDAILERGLKVKVRMV